MATVYIPSLVQDLTAGAGQVEVIGATMRDVINDLEARFPGVRDRLTHEGRLRPHIAIWIDGEISHAGLLQPVQDQSEIHFLPALSGGAA